MKTNRDKMFRLDSKGQTDFPLNEEIGTGIIEIEGDADIWLRKHGYITWREAQEELGKIGS